MPRTFFIADTHFGHTAIIAYERRPFADAAEMDRQLLENWNSVVAPEDHVWMLGDFALASAGRARELLAALNGRKSLVMGNHDRKHPPTWWQEAGFAFVSPYPVLFDEMLLLSHEPLYVNANMPYVNIFGHVHGNPAYKDVSDHHLCVSCERIAYTPISLESAREAIETARAGGER
jgi:calcineurin-like phosphoesterase family protein